MLLHPEAQTYLRLIAEWREANDVPPLHRLGPVRARQIVHDLVMASRPSLMPIDLAEDHMIQGRSGPRRIRLLRPKTAHQGLLPVALYFHGGGYVVGGVDESEHEPRRIAERLPALAISASYRLGPEHPFPAAIEDAYDALLWTAHNAQRYGGDPNRIMVGGTSAGAGLAVAVTRLASLENGPRIGLNYLLCPWLDLTLREPSVAAFGNGYDLDRELLEWFASCYVGATAQAADPLISPSRHPAPASLPPTIILAAECDPLRDEAWTYAARLEEAGVPVTHQLAPGLLHGFNARLHFMPSGDRYVRQVEAAMRRGIGLGG